MFSRRALVIVAALSLAACARHSDLPKLFAVPPTPLIAETGKPVNLASLKGNVVVYDFIYTTCTTSCPMMTAQMRALTEKVDEDAPVRFVSITVDPEHDTPQVLSAYAARVRNDPRWTFLTGDYNTILKLSIDGFKLAAGPPEKKGAEFLHSARFIVADKEGVVREYYGGTDGDAAEHVAATVKELVKE